MFSVYFTLNVTATCSLLAVVVCDQCQARCSVFHFSDLSAFSLTSSVTCVKPGAVYFISVTCLRSASHPV